MSKSADSIGRMNKFSHRNGPFPAPADGAAEHSPGMMYMLAVDRAMPRSIGDRARSAAMDEALGFAIRNRFGFSKSDGNTLDELSTRTTVGVFDPLGKSFYKMACTKGGTFASMWEKHHQTQPWIAALSFHEDAKDPVVTNREARVAPGIGVLLTPREGAAEPGLQTHLIGPERPMEAWWCSSFNADAIVLCRYRQDPTSARQAWYDRHGSPERVQKLTRPEWDALMVTEAETIEDGDAAEEQDRATSAEREGA